MYAPAAFNKSACCSNLDCYKATSLLTNRLPNPDPLLQIEPSQRTQLIIRSMQNSLTHAYVTTSTESPLLPNCVKNYLVLYPWELQVFPHSTTLFQWAQWNAKLPLYFPMFFFSLDPVKPFVFDYVCCMLTQMRQRVKQKLLIRCNLKSRLSGALNPAEMGYWTVHRPRLFL